MSRSPTSMYCTCHPAEGKREDCNMNIDSRVKLFPPSWTGMLRKCTRDVIPKSGCGTQVTKKRENFSLTTQPF